jgi:periplasmic protein TonB
MFDATLLDSSPQRVSILDWRHWVGAFAAGVLGGFAGYLILPLIFSPSSEARLVESLLLGIGVMFYELMLWYVLGDARHLGLNAGRWSVVLLLLNVAGFVAYLVYSAYKTGDWKRAALPIAYMLEGVVVCVLLLVPLIYTQALPDAHRWADFLIPAPPAGPPPVKRIRVRMVNSLPAHTAIEAPVRIPVGIKRVTDKPDSAPVAPSNYPFVPGGVDVGPGGTGTNPVLSTMLGEGSAPPPPVSKPSKPTRVFRPSNVEEAKLISGPKPPYPQMAIITRTQGTVELKAIIGKDGTIQELKVVSGPPLLINAALDTVRRWRYQPTLLNGEPVEVVTDITVNFILNEQ